MIDKQQSLINGAINGASDVTNNGAASAPPPQQSGASVAAKRRPDRAALCIAVILTAIAAVIFWDMTRLTAAAGYSQVGPATVPKAIAFGLLGLAVWTVFAAFRHDFPEREPQEIKPVLWIVLGLTAQMLLLNFLGFSIATGIMFALTAYGFGKRKLWYSVPIGIAACFAIWIVFAKLLQLSLPAGPLEHLFF